MEADIDGGLFVRWQSAITRLRTKSKDDVFSCYVHMLFVKNGCASCYISDDV